MQFLVIGKDGTDVDAPKRREQFRAAHIALGDELLAAGNMWYGAALIDDAGVMRGSMLMMNFKDEAELDAWLAREPYVVGNVWEQVDIQKCKTRDPWQFNRPKEFFQNM